MNELLTVKDLRKSFIKKGTDGKKDHIKAVDGISFSIQRKETLILAGESGSGKTTLGELLLRTKVPDSGRITFDGLEITDKKKPLKKIRMECQMIYQDPYASINPRMTVLDIIKEPLEIHSIGDREERNRLVLEALSQVKLEPANEIASKYPHMLSGGQRQRVAIARAIVIKPKLIIADEPVSMLDVSVRIGILELMKELQENLGISYLYITHDLSTASYVGHRIAIMYNGSIIETGPTNGVLSNPKHPYTQALLDSVSEPDPENLSKEKMIRIKDDSSLGRLQGCKFRSRCSYAIQKCKKEPPLEEILKERSVACFAPLT